MRPETTEKVDGAWNGWKNFLASRKITSNTIKAASHLNKQKYTKYPKTLLKLKEEDEETIFS